MGQRAIEHCTFETLRLRAGPWHEVAEEVSADLVSVVAGLLSESTTVALPDAWHGTFSLERASDWLDERDRESPTLLVVDRVSGQPIGLVFLYRVSIDAATTEVRIGYLVAEAAWGQGLASEIVAGLADWTRSEPSIHRLTAGVAATNRASARVLVKCGFQQIADNEGEEIYQLDVDLNNDWDSYADGWDQDEAARAYAAAAHESLRTALEARGFDLGGAHALDFGCGTGLLTERLVSSGATVHAVDTSAAMLTVLNAKIGANGWKDVRASTELPDTAAAYDLVVCSSVCSFLDDYPGTAQQLTTLLRPGGHFVQWDWERGDDDPDPHGLSKAQITEALGDAGLVDVIVDTGFTAAVGDQTMRPLMGCGRRSRQP